MENKYKQFLYTAPRALRTPPIRCLPKPPRGKGFTAAVAMLFAAFAFCMMMAMHVFCLC
jgi:hypothetical protein